VGAEPRRSAATRGFVEGRALAAIAEADGLEAGIWWRGALVGAIGIHGVQREPLRGSIGYWLAADAQGRGLVTRSVRALIAKAFDDLGYERIDIRADVANRRSRAVPERLGFAFEGVLRREFFDGRRYVDQAVYGLLREEWRG
jgi:ribosomal-protein-serine acetyltransferase